MILSFTLCLAIAFGIVYWVAVKSKGASYIDDYEVIKISLVSAGSIEKEKREANVCILGASFQINNENINHDLYRHFIVDGRSMNKFDIRNGDMVFVDNEYTEAELFDKKDAIVVFRIEPEGQNKIEYKLRKFIGFYDFNKTPDIQKWVKENHPELNFRELKTKLEEKKTKEKIRECIDKNSRLVLSETTRKKNWLSPKRNVCYSFHPESSMVGKVRYQVPKEYVYIVNKT
ncbi:MAG: hypothetical protein LBD45_09265 [Bacteroidales bacterium]|jgi:hypothetical protein|nr:hypothetical protein [Bacteroidales bacterium]